MKMLGGIECIMQKYLLLPIDCCLHQSISVLIVFYQFHRIHLPCSESNLMMWKLEYSRSFCCHMHTRSRVDSHTLLGNECHFEHKRVTNKRDCFTALCTIEGERSIRRRRKNDQQIKKLKRKC